MRLVKDEYIDLFKKIGSEDIFQMTRDGTLDPGGLTMKFYRNCQVLKENLVCVFRTFYTCVIIHFALVKKKKILLFLMLNILGLWFWFIAFVR